LDYRDVCITFGVVDFGNINLIYLPQYNISIIFKF
jgi:hypothetical protein